MVMMSLDIDVVVDYRIHNLFMVRVIVIGRIRFNSYLEPMLLIKAS